MWLSDISIKRPVLAIVVNAIIVVLGLFAALGLPVREYPDIDPPIVSITTSYSGAAPEIVANELTEVIEGAIAGIDGIRLITSSSTDGRSRVSIEFSSTRDLDAAASDVRDAVSRVQRRLPVDADAPVVSKSSSDSQPMMWMMLTSTEHPADWLTDYAERYIVDRLSTVDGVASVQIGGQRRYAMRIWLDPDRMAAVGVTVDDVEQGLRAGNIELPAGRVRTDARDLTVRAVTRLESAEEFARLIIREEGGIPLRLSDVATVVRGIADESTQVRINGGTGVGIGVIRQSQANTLNVATGVKEQVERIRPSLPTGVDLMVGYDESIFVEASIGAVIEVFLEALAIVVLVIVVFLRSARATFIPAITIPVSLIGAFTVMALFGYSINVLTMLALLLAIGLVVDDAIVVIENVQRRIDAGEPRLLAAVNGTREVGFAVLATSITLISVFIPISFLQGDVGRLFAEFGIVMAAAVFFSTIVALTLAPMLSSNWLKPHAGARAGSEGGSGAGMPDSRLQKVYRAGVTWAIAHPATTLASSIAAASLAVLFFVALPKELAPTEDRGVVIVPSIAPEGATPDFVDRAVDKVEAALMPLREEGIATNIFSTVGVGSGNRGFTIVSLAKWEDRDVTQSEVVRRILPDLVGIPEVQAFPNSPPGLGRSGFGQPVQFVIGGPDYPTLEDWATQLLFAARENPGLVNPRIDYERTRQQIEVSIDRDRASVLGLDVERIGRALQILLASLESTTYIDRGQEYDVILQAPQSARADLDAIRNYFVRSSTTGELMPLSSIVTLKEVGAAASLGRVDRLPAITLQAGLVPGYDLGSALAFLDRTAAEILPPEARISYTGQSRDFKESASATLVTFALALLLVYLVLAAQFESFIHPAIILLSAPLAVTGALVGLYFGGLTFNIYGQVGLILLIGLMAKNGILVVEFANQLRQRGRPVREAVIEASVVRLRPILMTTLAQVLGAIPLVAAAGAGSESRGTIGIVVIAGMSFATTFTLFLTPVLYNLLARFARPANTVADALKSERRAAAERARETGRVVQS